MEFKQLVEAAEKWCSGNPFDLIFAEEEDERRLDFYAEPGISFYVLCPDNLTGGTDNFVSVVVWVCACIGDDNADDDACACLCVLVCFLPVPGWRSGEYEGECARVSGLCVRCGYGDVTAVWCPHSQDVVLATTSRFLSAVVTT